MNVSGDASAVTAGDRASTTREKLIHAGERLFADRGFAAVALRSVCAAAGQRNPSSVHYHFRDKAGLLDAIFEHREAQLESSRADLLSEAEAAGQQHDVRTLLRILFLPYSQLYEATGDIATIKLYAFYLNHLRPAGHHHPADRVVASTTTSRAVVQALRHRLAYLGTRRFYERLEGVSAMFFSLYIQHDTRRGRGVEVDALFADSIDMMMAALCAPPLGPVRQARRGGS